MSRTVADAELEVTDPSGSAVTTVPVEDLLSVEIDEQAQDAKDTGSIEIANHDQAYNGASRITSGDKLVFRVRLEGESSLSDRWTAIARSPRDHLRGADLQTLEIPAEDFPFCILDWRTIYNTFDGAPIAGSADAILDTILANEAPEIGTGQIASVAQTTDAQINGRTALDVVREELAPIADALCYNDGEDLVFEPLGDVSAKRILTPSDFRGRITVTGDDDELANLVRVDGGTDHASDDEQPNQSSYTRVTDSSRITRQIQTRKSEVARVLVHVRTDGTSSDGIVVRLQADRGGSPVDVTDQQSDIARKTLAKDFLASDGMTTFILPAHDLAPKENPWLIVEADGPDGHDIGVDSNGVPRYRAEYPYPLLARLPRQASQNEYRRRDHRIKDESIDTERGVRDTALSYGRHHDRPELSLEGEADSLRAHQLRPGDAVDMNGWTGRVSHVSGTWIVTGRESDFGADRNRLTTTLTLTDASSL